MNGQQETGLDKYNTTTVVGVVAAYCGVALIRAPMLVGVVTALVTTQTQTVVNWFSTQL